MGLKVAEIDSNQNSGPLKFPKMTFLDRLNYPKFDLTQNWRGDKMIKFQQIQVLQGQSSQNVKSKSGIFHTLMLLLLSFFMSECSLVAAFWYSEVIWDTSNTQVLYFTFKVKMTNFFLNLLMWVIKLDFFYLPFLTLLFNLDVILEL